MSDYFIINFISKPEIGMWPRFYRIIKQLKPIASDLFGQLKKIKKSNQFLNNLCSFYR